MTCHKERLESVVVCLSVPFLYQCSVAQHCITQVPSDTLDNSIKEGTIISKLNRSSYSNSIFNSNDVIFK